MDGLVQGISGQGTHSAPILSLTLHQELDAPGLGAAEGSFWNCLPAPIVGENVSCLSQCREGCVRGGSHVPCGEAKSGHCGWASSFLRPPPPPRVTPPQHSSSISRSFNYSLIYSWGSVRTAQSLSFSAVQGCGSSGTALGGWPPALGNFTQTRTSPKAQARGAPYKNHPTSPEGFAFSPPTNNNNK